RPSGRAAGGIHPGEEHRFPSASLPTLPDAASLLSYGIAPVRLPKLIRRSALSVTSRDTPTSPATASHRGIPTVAAAISRPALVASEKPTFCRIIRRVARL